MLQIFKFSFYSEMLRNVKNFQNINNSLKLGERKGGQNYYFILT